MDETPATLASSFANTHSRLSSSRLELGALQIDAAAPRDGPRLIRPSPRRHNGAGAVTARRTSDGQYRHQAAYQDPAQDRTTAAAQGHSGQRRLHAAGIRGHDPEGGVPPERGPG